MSCYGDDGAIFSIIVLPLTANVECQQSFLLYYIGVANRRYLRYLPPDYADGISVPRQRKNGSFLRSPREISVAVHTGTWPMSSSKL